MATTDRFDEIHPLWPAFWASHPRCSCRSRNYANRCSPDGWIRCNRRLREWRAYQAKHLTTATDAQSVAAVTPEER